MKLFTCLAICLISTIALTAPLQAQTPNETEVKLELNEAAAAYRKGNFAEAQAHSEKALQLDPENKTAMMFVARTIHAQYKPGDYSPENVAKAREASALKLILIAENAEIRRDTQRAVESRREDFQIQ